MLKIKIFVALNAVGWTLLICSVVVNYMLWTGKVIRPEWVQDYVSVLSDGMKNNQSTKH